MRVQAANRFSATIKATVLVIVAVAFSLSKAKSQTTLVAGDVAIIALNPSGTDAFAFVLLKNISANTVINFTDNGMDNPTTGRTGEGFLTFTAPSNLTAGTVTRWTNGQSIAGTGWSSNNPSNFALNASGEQLFAFQGSTSNWVSQSGITLLFGLDGGNAGGFLTTGTAAAGTSYQPSALTLGTTVFTFASSNGNGYFANGTSSQTSVSVTNTRAGLLSLFADNTKWFKSSSAVTFPTYSITVQWPILSSAGANGAITPNGTTNVNNGNNQSYTITPDPGYAVADVLVDGSSAGAVTSYTFNNVITPHTISASFSVIPPNPTVNLSVSTNTASETAATVVTVTATASSAVTGSQTVLLGVSGTNITATDYSLSNTTITIPNGGTTGSVTFTILDDADVESTETATLTISSPSAGISLGATTTKDITITDNDAVPPPVVNLSVSTNSASEAAATIVTVTATASSAVTGPQTVSLGVSGTNITAGDYSLSNTTITIANGSATGSVTFTITDDAITEGTETTVLTISNPSAGITLGATTSQNISIADNDVSLMRITEYMYNGGGAGGLGEFVEFTNTGSTAIDMTGWSFDDNSRTTGSQSLTAFGNVQPGESVIFTELDAGTFRSNWNLCSGIKIIGGNSNNLGREDEINLYNASGVLIDRLTYGDQTFSPGSIRTVAISGWVNAAGLGNNAITQWALSSAADAENSFTSTLGEIGSPGKSTRATVFYDPCTFVAGAPTIAIDVAATTNALDGGASVSPASPYAISGVINDATDPAKITGIDFTIGDDITPVGSLTVTAVSNAQGVVPDANLVLSGTGASRNLKITPAGVGYSSVTITVNDGTNNTSYVLNYAASQSSAISSKWLTGIADASSAIALDDDYMVVANDETNFLYVYNRNQPGLFVKKYDFNQGNVLSLTDGAPAYKEVDLEAGVRSITHPSRLYWLGSMTNSSNSPYENKPNRNRLFAVTVNGTGVAAVFNDVLHYNNLRNQLITWGDNHFYDFSGSAAGGVDPKKIDGFNAEGMVFGPDNTTLYIGFRAPLVPTGTRTKAVIAPIQNFEAWADGGFAGNPVIGSPIELDLGGRGIREMTRLSNGNYIIVAGRYDNVSMPAIYRWTGIATDAPMALPEFDVTGLNVEGVMGVNQGGLLSLSKLQVISDNGDMVYYNDGIAAKDLSNDNYRKFSSDIISSSAGALLPLDIEYFTAARRGTDVVLNWKTGSQDDGILFEVLRSTNGYDFSVIHTTPAVTGQNTYTFTDMNVPGVRLYYRISSKNIAGKKQYSSIRSVSSLGSVDMVRVYPNPVTNGVFSIVINKTGTKQVSIYNNAGSLYRYVEFTETAKDIRTEGWPKGYYLLRIITADGTVIVQKIAVQ